MSAVSLRTIVGLEWRGGGMRGFERKGKVRWGTGVGVVEGGIGGLEGRGSLGCRDERKGESGMVE